MTNKPILAITMGDPGGIGPEIIAKALAHAEVFDHSRPLVIGERRALEAAIRITGGHWKCAASTSQPRPASVPAWST